jgi:hypothetical protein
MRSLPRWLSSASRVEHRAGVLVEVGHEHHQAPATAGLARLVQRSRERALAAALRGPVDAVERVQQDRQVLGRGRHEVDDVLVEGHEAHAVPLLAREVGEARHQVARVVQLGQGVAR